MEQILFPFLTICLILDPTRKPLIPYIATYQPRRHSHLLTIPPTPSGFHPLQRLKLRRSKLVILQVPLPFLTTAKYLQFL